MRNFSFINGKGLVSFDAWGATGAVAVRGQRDFVRLEENIFAHRSNFPTH